MSWLDKDRCIVSAVHQADEYTLVFNEEAGFRRRWNFHNYCIWYLRPRHIIVCVRWPRRCIKSPSVIRRGNVSNMHWHGQYWHRRLWDRDTHPVGTAERRVHWRSQESLSSARSNNLRNRWKYRMCEVYPTIRKVLDQTSLWSNNSRDHSFSLQKHKTSLCCEV